MSNEHTEEQEARAPSAASIPMKWGSIHQKKTRITIALIASLIVAAGILHAVTRFPPDTEPRGAYLRIASALTKKRPEAMFAYLEEDAQVACYTILNYAKKATDLIRNHYPSEHRRSALPRYAKLATHKTPAQLWATIARQEGWLLRLRKDLSGIKETQRVGIRATVITARGTRYPFRRRPNKIWGLTLFTADLEARSQKLARDWDLIQRAAKDFKRKETPNSPAPKGEATD